jgi:RNA polymerase sigma-70 factor (ECF subfamily)
MPPERERGQKAARSLPSLAARAQLGDRDALEHLLRALEAPILDHIRAIVHDRDLADDVLQGTLLRVSRGLGSLREPEWVRAWAYRIATRDAVRAARHERDRRTEAVEDWAEVPAPDTEEVAAENLLDELPLHLDALPRRTQLVLRMRYLQELSQQEVAEALDIPIGTVKSRIAYGLSLLRSTLNRRA